MSPLLFVVNRLRLQNWQVNGLTSTVGLRQCLTKEIGAGLNVVQIRPGAKRWSLFKRNQNCARFVGTKPFAPFVAMPFVTSSLVLLVVWFVGI